MQEFLVNMYEYNNREPILSRVVLAESSHKIVESLIQMQQVTDFYCVVSKDDDVTLLRKENIHQISVSHVSH